MFNFGERQLTTQATLLDLPVYYLGGVKNPLGKPYLSCLENLKNGALILTFVKNNHLGYSCDLFLIADEHITIRELAPLVSNYYSDKALSLSDMTVPFGPFIEGHILEVVLK